MPTLPPSKRFRTAAIKGTKATRPPAKATRTPVERSVEASASEKNASPLPALKGYGSLRGKLKLDPRVDLSKPIAAQVARWKP